MEIKFESKVIKAMLDEISSKLKNSKEKINVEPCTTYFITHGENRTMVLQNQEEAEVHWANATIITTDIELWEQFIEQIKNWQREHDADVQML